MKYAICYADLGGFTYAHVSQSNVNPQRYCGYYTFVNVRGKDIPYAEAKLTYSFETVEGAWDSVIAGNWVKDDTFYGEKPCTT